MHYREPIKFTCPLIDKCIQQIKSVIDKSIDVSYSRDVDTMEEWIEDTVWLLDKIMEAFEELRDSNDKLRDWGSNEANRVDELELKIVKLEEKIEELENELEYLEQNK